MSLLDSHSVTFHRFIRAGKDALGNYTSTTEAPGFPVVAPGIFEQTSGKARRGEEGMRSNRAATFRSGSFYGGRVGDYVDFRGTRFLVDDVVDQRQSVGRPHFEYVLVREELGNRAKFNESDAARVDLGES